MKKYLIIFLAIPMIVFGEEYGDFYEKHSPTGNAGDYCDGDRTGDKTDPNDFYEDFPEKEVDMSTIPDLLDKSDGKDKDKGMELGDSVKGNVSSEKGLRDILKNMQNGGDLEPLAKTYLCPTDNATYPDKNECVKNCMSVCEDYKFQASVSCQNAREMLRITPDHIGANPPFSIKYQDKIYHTGKIDAVCGNGYISSGTAYEWSFTKDGLNFVTPASKGTLGECRDMAGKAFMATFNDYYDPMIYALQAHISKLGYVTGSNINGGDFSLSVNVIVAGACDENSLQSDIPNKDAMQMREGKLDLAQAQNIAEKDPNYAYITEGTDFEEKSCSIINKPLITSKTEEIKKDGAYSICTDHIVLGRLTRSRDKISIEFRGGKEDGSDPFYNCPADPSAQADGGWFTAETFTVSGDVGDVVLNYSIAYGGGCNAGKGTASLALGTQANNIECPGDGGQTPAISYTYAYSSMKDELEIAHSDGCSASYSGCKESRQAVCDLYGGNCVEIKKDGVSTGNKPQTFCNELKSPVDTYMVCSDGKNITAEGNKNSFGKPAGFFTVKLSYACEKKTEEYDYSGFIEQNQSISDTMKVTESGDVSFTGLDKDGNPVDFKTNVTLAEAECEKTCKVQSPGKTDIPIINSDGSSILPNTVVKDGVVKTLPINSYKVCSKSGENWECPLETGETMISDCECIDDFMDTILQMRFIDESSKNMKCSSK